MPDVVKCPNCNQPVTVDSGFCIFCGTKLPALKPVSEEIRSETGTITVRKCKNGHEFADDKLAYCPLCGLPFENIEMPSPKEETWICSCGNTNPFDSNFCEKCGRAKEMKTPKRKTETPKPTGSTAIPEGMYTPTPDDLKKKR